MLSSNRSQYLSLRLDEHEPGSWCMPDCSESGEVGGDYSRSRWLVGSMERIVSVCKQLLRA